jgi:hypothetical protein
MRSIPVKTGTRRRPEDPKQTLARLWLDLDAARRAIVRGRPSSITHTARGLMSALRSVRLRVELEHAAAAFAEGLDERPEAEQWVFFAVAARATLDEAEKNGASVLAPELEELDLCLEDAREAVLLLEPEDYKEALSSTPPNTRAWWGERARLDAGLSEIDLERVLGELSEPDARPTLPPIRA